MILKKVKAEISFNGQAKFSLKLEISIKGSALCPSEGKTLRAVPSSSSSYASQVFAGSKSVLAYGNNLSSFLSSFPPPPPLHFPVLSSLTLTS